MEAHLRNLVRDVIEEESTLYCEAHSLTMLPLEDSNSFYIMGINTGVLEISYDYSDGLANVEFRSVLVNEVTPASKLFFFNIMSNPEFRSFIPQEEVVFEDNKLVMRKRIQFEAQNEEIAGLNYLMSLTNLNATSRFLNNYINEKFVEQLDVLSN